MVDWSGSPKPDSGSVTDMSEMTTKSIGDEAGVIERANFDPKVCTYWLLSGTLVLTVTIIGIPFAVLWFLLGSRLTRRWLARMECVLTERTLTVKKGVMVRVEKTIPLEKITDLAMVQGPIMRAFGLQALSVETAGTSGPGALVSLVGIVDAPEFREKVLRQRDLISGGGSGKQMTDPGDGGDEMLAVLGRMSATLERIEEGLKTRG